MFSSRKWVKNCYIRDKSNNVHAQQKNGSSSFTPSNKNNNFNNFTSQNDESKHGVENKFYNVMFHDKFHHSVIQKSPISNSTKFESVTQHKMISVNYNISIRTIVFYFYNTSKQMHNVTKLKKRRRNLVNTGCFFILRQKFFHRNSCEIFGKRLNSGANCSQDVPHHFPPLITFLSQILSKKKYFW